MWQYAPAAREAPQLLVCKNSLASIPVIVIPTIVNVVVPTLVRVTVFAKLVTSSPTEPKLSWLGESFAVVPAPLRLTFCGLPEASSVKLKTALRVPTEVGLNLTFIVQLALTANDAPQLVALIKKSPLLVPRIAMLLMVKIIVPVFLSVTIFPVLAVPIA
jgi:hypothetical protein